MKILVTGNKGFIGSHMERTLRNQGHDVTTYEWGEQLPSLKGLDWCMHFGAISSTNERNIEKLQLQNFDFCKWIYHQCARENVNFQFSSSAAVYGIKNTTFKETDFPDPQNPYAKFKYLFEEYIKNNPQPIITQIFRYFNVYGEGEDHKDQPSPFTTFKKQAKETGIIRIFEGSNNYRRDFVPVEKVVKIQNEFVKVFDSGIWNIGSGMSMSFLQVASLIKENIPCEIVERTFPSYLKDSYQYYTCANLNKLNSTLQKYGIKL